MAKNQDNRAKMTRGVLASVSGDILFVNVTKNGIIRKQRVVKSVKKQK